MPIEIKVPETGDKSKPRGYEDLDIPPDKRELLLYHESKRELEALRIKHENLQIQLRELTQLKHEKFTSLTNSVASTFVITTGSWIATGTEIVSGWFGDACFPVGVIIVGIGVVLGVVKPPVDALIWKIFLKDKNKLICPHCRNEIEK